MTSTLCNANRVVSRQVFGSVPLAGLRLCTSHFPYQFVHFPAFLSELLLAGFPLHPELTIPSFGTVALHGKAMRIQPFFGFPFALLLQGEFSL